MNWAEFARRYNGIDYKRNNYDVKMAQSYENFKGENIDCSEYDLRLEIALRIGDRGRQVVELQRKLADYKLLSSNDADGFFGERTQMAVKAFQCLNGLKADGIFGRATRKVLFR